MRNTTNLAINFVEQGNMPDFVVRAGIRRLLRARLTNLALDNGEAASQSIERFIAGMSTAPIAPLAEKANDQHYEVPAQFFEHVLGPQRKYSSAFWSNDASSLDEAEISALALTCDHAQLEDGQRILELGCGWGSLTLWMARHYPHSTILAVSNSRSQRDYIKARTAALGLRNVRLVTADMNAFDSNERFDRVVSVEMFEHMRNWRELFGCINRWLVPGACFFMHIFCHRSVPYAFVEEDDSDWMSRHFFSGGMMPSDELPLRFQEDLQLMRRWRWDGRHYEKTANAWLANLDAKRDALWPVLEQTYGIPEAGLWFVRWRLFFMACAELFGYDSGQQWWVSHYLFRRPVS